MNPVGAALAAVSLLVSSAAVAAAPQDYVTVSLAGVVQDNHEQVALQVSTRGLDLATPEGAMALRKRVTRAIAYACNPGDRLNADLAPDYQCRQEMAVSAEPALAEITQAALAR